MSRYGWSSGRDQISPYTSMSNAPAVTDEDFSYITSQDLDDVQYYPRTHSVSQPVPEDDVLLIKNKGVTYPAHFPAYAIGDGKLFVKDVKERVGLMMDISLRNSRKIKLLYKGRQLKDPLAAVRDYGVKNNSELMAVIPQMDDDSSPSEEEMVIVDAPQETKSRRKKKKRGGKKKADGADGSSVAASSPRDSASTFEPPKSPPPPQFTLSGATSGPLKQLDDITNEFVTKWLPLCDNYLLDPPTDPKKRDDEHRKISETIMQQILLKLDCVESEGIAEVRPRRKALIQHVQDTLKKLDVVRDS